MPSDRNSQILVFDVGGSHIASSVFDLADETLGKVQQISVSPDVPSEEFFAAFGALANKLRSSSAVASYGAAVAIPNPFDHRHGISYMRHKYQHLYGINIRRGLAEVLKCDPDSIQFLHDATAFLIGELQQGAAAGTSRAVGITLGTGIGSAFAVDNKIVTDGFGIPPGGEIWNLPYRDSILENSLSSLAIRRKYEQLTGVSAEVRDIAEFAKEQEEARETFEWFGSELARAIRRSCLAFAPECIVLGGAVSRAGGLFMSATERELAGLGIRLPISSLFDRAPLVGAGVCWKQNYGREEKVGKFQTSAVAEK